MAGGVQSLKFLPVALPDISGVNCTGSWATIRRSIDGQTKKSDGCYRPIFSRHIFTAVACRVPVSAFAGRAVARKTGRTGFSPTVCPEGIQVGTCEGTPRHWRTASFKSVTVISAPVMLFNLCFHSCPVFLVRTNCPGNFLPRARKFRCMPLSAAKFLASHIPENSPSSR